MQQDIWDLSLQQDFFGEMSIADRPSWLIIIHNQIIYLVCSDPALEVGLANGKKTFSANIISNLPVLNEQAAHLLGDMLQEQSNILLWRL